MNEPPSIRSVQDFGTILLQAQKGLERVRARLEALPTQKSDANPSRNQSAQDLNTADIFGSLKNVLDRTETNLRVQAETLLTTMENSRQSNLPALSGGPRRARSASSASFFAQQQELLVEQEIQRARGQQTVKWQQTAGTLESRPSAYLDRSNAARTAELRARPNLERSRSMLIQKYGLGSRAPNMGRDISRYGVTDGKVVHEKMGPGANVVHKKYRNNPRLFPIITQEDTKAGLAGMVTRGVVPRFLDVGPALNSFPAPFAAQAVQFHNFYEQFDKHSSLVQEHNFNLSNVRVDLNQELLGRKEMQKPPEEKPEEKKQTEVRLPKLVAIKPKVAEFNRDGEAQLVQVQSQAELDLAEIEKHKIRDYNELLDQYSLHHFIIRKGVTLSSTPEFVSFQRKHEFMWGAVSHIVSALEDFLASYSVPLAHVDGQRVAALAQTQLKVPSPEQLLECLQNHEQVAPLIRLPGQRYKGENGQRNAATKIQSTVRMYLVVRRFKHLRLMVKKAVVIQRAWRRYSAMRATRVRCAQAWEAKLAKWREKWGSSFQANWDKIQNKSRVAVHIPSLSLTKQQRLQMHNYTMRQNAQLSRLCDVGQEGVDVCYVAPMELSPDIFQYYLKLLEVGGVKDAQQHVKVLTPENRRKFPEHFSLAKHCYYSPKLMKRIREFCRGRPAYIVPYSLGFEDLQLAVALDLPLLSADPDVAALFGSKSGCNRIFAAAAVPVPPGARDIYDEEDLYEYLAKAMLNNVDVDKWVLKHDSELFGRGIAYFEASSIPAWKEICMSRDMYSDEQLVEVQTQLQEELSQWLGKVVVFACPALYDNSWGNYLRAMMRAGGVVEASPPNITSSPTVCMLIEPDGTVNITSSHDQLFQTPYVRAGTSFPSTSSSLLLHPAALAIGRACFKENIIGHVAVDFVAYVDSATGHESIVAVDLDVHMGAPSCSFQLFDFLMKGSFRKSSPDNAARARYTVFAPGKDSSSAASTAASTARSSQHGAPEENLVERYFSASSYIYQPMLASIQFGSFFNLCRLKGVSYDLRSKAGTAFMLVDSLASGTLGLLSVGKTGLWGLESLSNALSFLNEHVGSDKGGSSMEHVYASESNLRNVLLSIKSAVRHQQDAISQQ